MEHCCSDMQEMIEEENSIIWIPQFREYGIPIRDGGSSFLQMQFCPWCGTRLPESLREKFFNTLEAMGIDYPCPPEEIPENMRSEKWWQEQEKS